MDTEGLSPWAKRQILQKLSSGNKYKNKKTDRGKLRFDSEKEARRYDELCGLMSAGEIRGLKLQPEYTLQEGFVTADGERVRAVRYRADFCYEKKDEGGDWRLVVEDVKGVKTDVYKLKRKLMLEKFGISVREV